MDVKLTFSVADQSQVWTKTFEALGLPSNASDGDIKTIVLNAFHEEKDIRIPNDSYEVRRVDNEVQLIPNVTLG